MWIKRCVHEFQVWLDDDGGISTRQNWMKTWSVYYTSLGATRHKYIKSFGIRYTKSTN